MHVWYYIIVLCDFYLSDVFVISRPTGKRGGFSNNFIHYGTTFYQVPQVTLQILCVS